MSRRVEQLGVGYYKLKINDAGTIELNAGATGNITVVGNLNVSGNTTTVSSTNLEINDNTITLNKGESGSGVSLNTSGFVVDRGGLADAKLLFDETKNTIRNGSTIQGSFKLEDNDGNQFGLYASSIRTDSNSDLYLLADGTGVVKVTGTVNYEKQISAYTGTAITPDASQPDGLSAPTDDDILPNTRYLIDYVRDYHLYNFQDRISKGDSTLTRVIVTDTENSDTTSGVKIDVDGTTIQENYAAQVKFFNNVIVTSSGISLATTNADLEISGGAGGSVKINNPVTVPVTPAGDVDTPASGSNIYGGTIAGGGSGLFFKNEDSITEDELVSRSKAIVFSLLF